MIAFLIAKEDYFSNKWISYCKEKNIEFKIIHPMEENLIEKTRGIEFLLWHWNLFDLENYQLAKELIYIFQEVNNIKVFPDFKTIWFYDDKIAQSLVFQSLQIKTPRFWIFYNKKKALDWLEEAKFPLVFKLRKGSSSSNVQLIRTKKKAIRKINRMYSKGMQPHRVPYKKAVSKNMIRKAFGFGFKHTFSVLKSFKRFPKERNYVYFQEFIEGCEMDYRILVLGQEKAFGFIRYNREKDFRASGSGKFDIDHRKIDKRMVEISFRIAKRLGLQSVAFDFLKKEDTIYLLEMSYDFVPNIGETKGLWYGYWNSQLEWISKSVDPVISMLTNLINQR